MAKDLAGGIGLAARSIDSGAAAKKLDELVKLSGELSVA
jgi:anthranilate phosphoribosyltransferase